MIGCTCVCVCGISQHSTLVSHDPFQHDKYLESNFDVLRDQSGATCTAVLIGPTQIVFANIGDSRSLLSRCARTRVSVSVLLLCIFCIGLRNAVLLFVLS